MDTQTQALASRWQFEATEEILGGYCSKVYADATRVLKVPFQGEELVSGFAAALSLSGNVGPRVFEGDPATGSILMERLLPGTPLQESALSDSQRLDIAAGLAIRIRETDPAGCMPLIDYFERLDPLAEELIETTARKVFLHGDLHHFNILRHGDDWLAIDPKGLVGDASFEPAAYLRNPIDEIPTLPNLETLTRARIHQFSERLGLSPWRIAAWALVDRRSDDPGPKWRRVVDIFERLEAEFRHT